MLEVCPRGVKKVSPKYLGDTFQVEEHPRKQYPKQLYGRLRDKPLFQLSDGEVHYILEQLLGGDSEDEY